MLDYKIFHIPLDLSVFSVARRDTLLDARRRVGHLHYFTKETAIETIRYCGYEIIDTDFTARAVELDSSRLRTNLMKLPRALLSKVSPDLAARISGRLVADGAGQVDLSANSCRLGMQP